MSEVRVLTLRQPWAWAVVYSSKGIENRSWLPRYKQKGEWVDYRGPLLVHAGKGMSRKEYEQAREAMESIDVFVPPMQQLRRGGIIGFCKLVDVIDPFAEEPHSLLDDEWYAGDPDDDEPIYGWVLDERRSLPFIPCNGKLGLWKPDKQLMELVEQAWRKRYGEIER